MSPGYLKGALICTMIQNIYHCSHLNFASFVCWRQNRVYSLFTLEFISSFLDSTILLFPLIFLTTSLWDCNQRMWLTQNQSWVSLTENGLPVREPPKINAGGQALDTHPQVIDLWSHRVLFCLLCFITFTSTTYNLFPEEYVFSMLITFSCTIQYCADSLK